VYWSKDDIRNRIERSKVVVFSKGKAGKPKDGFSERALSALEDTGRPYEVVDVSEDSSIVAALRAYAGRITLPMVYVDGALVSSSETLQHMVDNGELKAKVDRAFS
jgi:glutaredoxin-related protein